MKKFATNKMLFSLLLALLIAIGMIAISEYSYHQSTKAAKSIEGAQHVRNLLAKLMQQLLDSETGQRGYLLTGDARYLEPYTRALEDINQTLDGLRNAFIYNSELLAGFGQMSRNISKKLAEMDLTVRMRQQGKEEAWKFVVNTDVGIEIMENIRKQALNLSFDSEQQMQLGQTQINQTIEVSRAGIVIVALISLLAFAMYLLQSKALVESGDREKEALLRERDKLDGEVRDRTSELTKLATHLQNVREDERGHLARELHDELGAMLTAAKLDVARLKSRLSPVQTEATERVGNLTQTLNQMITMTRRIVEDLRPSSLMQLGIVSSLEILTREFAARSEIQVATNLEPVKIDDATQLTIYRLVQESLSNIGKYAQATHVIVVLSNMQGYVNIEVKDDGKGFDMQGIPPRSHGLVGMRHRVETSGGRLRITSSPGNGTYISASLPTVSMQKL